MLGRTLGALFDGPADIARHNRRALREHEDMYRWMKDEGESLAIELNQADAELAARGMLQSGERGHRENRIRTESARRYRDRRSAYDRKLEDLCDAETVVHRAYRRLLRRRWPMPNSPDFKVRLEANDRELATRLGVSSPLAPASGGDTG
jgi:hypothetical protein